MPREKMGKPWWLGPLPMQTAEHRPARERHKRGGREGGESEALAAAEVVGENWTKFVSSFTLLFFSPHNPSFFSLLVL